MKKKISSKLPCVAFTGGGTGGHIYPGLAVVDALKKNTPCRVIWLGSSKGMDASLVEKSGSVDAFVGVPSGKLRRYFSLKNVSDVFKIFAGFIKAFFVLKKEKPLFLFSKGGFVSVPPCYAAKMLKIPVYTHECDFSPGLATKLNVRVAKNIFLSYKETLDFLSNANKEKAIVTGNPVRPVFYNANKEKGLSFLGITKEQTKPILLVLGGSSGAKQINDIILNDLGWFCQRFVVVHQTGLISGETLSLDSETVKGFIEKKEYFPFQFVHKEMPDVLACADVILSRSGANSLWESSVVGVPLVLLPLEGSGTRGDQVENAQYFAKNNAAFVCKKEVHTTFQIKEFLTMLLNAERRQNMAENARKLVGNENPAETIAKILSEKIK